MCDGEEQDMSIVVGGSLEFIDVEKVHEIPLTDE